MKNRLALALCATLVAGVGSASAADLPYKAPVAAPAVAPVYNWTGFYAGVHAGWIWNDADAATSYTGPAALVFAPFSYAHDADGFMAGGQIGFNYQITNWVVGLEADLSWADADGAAALAGLPLLAGGVAALATHASAHDMNWFGTVRGRLGFAANNLLVYITGGVAFADVDYATATFLPGPAVTFVGAGSETNAGWTLGGGFEWGFAPNWSAKAEYLYYDLGDTTVVGMFPGLATTVVTNFENEGHILRVGLNYRFGWGGPVVARY